MYLLFIVQDATRYRICLQNRLKIIEREKTETMLIYDNWFLFITKCEVWKSCVSFNINNYSIDAWRNAITFINNCHSSENKGATQSLCAQFIQNTDMKRFRQNTDLKFVGTFFRFFE